MYYLYEVVSPQIYFISVCEVEYIVTVYGKVKLCYGNPPDYTKGLCCLFYRKKNKKLVSNFQ